LLTRVNAELYLPANSIWDDWTLTEVQLRKALHVVLFL
jgi:hypothetical protein